VEQDRFPDLSDRDNLWQVLAVIASRKAQAYLRSHHRQKRGGGLVRGESAIVATGSDSSPAGIGAVLGPAPSPEFAAQFAEECQRLLDCLADEQLQAIALLKMQGFTIEEIAARVACTKRAVQRRLEIIRRTWRDRLSDG
jgi:DNA-directed RNA polymerase specialized sigma24 family protein